ncbi:hypothetical protein PT2222_370016 [Paraburkholderia tropica]
MVGAGRGIQASGPSQSPVCHGFRGTAERAPRWSGLLHHADLRPTGEGATGIAGRPGRGLHGALARARIAAAPAFRGADRAHDHGVLAQLAGRRAAGEVIRG